MSQQYPGKPLLLFGHRNIKMGFNRTNKIGQPGVANLKIESFGWKKVFGSNEAESTSGIFLANNCNILGAGIDLRNYSEAILTKLSWSTTAPDTSFPDPYSIDLKYNDRNCDSGLTSRITFKSYSVANTVQSITWEGFLVLTRSGGISNEVLLNHTATASNNKQSISGTFYVR